MATLRAVSSERSADDWQLIVEGWELTLAADGYSPRSQSTYAAGVASLRGWLAEHAPEVAPADLTRNHVRGWVASVREHNGATTAATYFAGVRHLCRWLVAEGETTVDATAGVKYPTPSEPATPVLSDDELKRLIGTASGTRFLDRRDAAIVWLLSDAGLRLAELTNLRVEDVDLKGRLVYVVGKGSGRHGPRHRVAAFGLHTAQALNRYLRVREAHPYAELDWLWLGRQGRLAATAIREMVKRRGRRIGIAGLHPHVLRHTWASEFRRNGGSEGDLMVLGGWRNRAMLDRYGKSAAADRAAEAYRARSLGDRL